MTIEEAAKASGIIQPEHLQSFLEYLVQVPRRAEMLAQPHSAEERLQGDLLQKQPFAILDSAGQPKVREMTVVVMNNTCDLQAGRSSTITYAAASAYAAFSKWIEARLGHAKARSYLSNVQRNKIHELLYVGPNPIFPDGLVIHLDRLCTVDARLYETALTDGMRIASFEQNGFYFLLIKLTRHLARAETQDVSR